MIHVNESGDGWIVFKDGSCSGAQALYLHPDETWKDVVPTELFPTENLAKEALKKTSG